MNVSIKKNGILKAGGAGIGENLILNGNGVSGFNGQFGSPQWWGKWYANSAKQPTDFGIVNKYGKNWFHFKSYYADGDAPYSGMMQYSNGSGTGSVIKPNTNYTISAVWFSMAPTKGCYWLHMRSTDGGNNLSQVTKSFDIGLTPQRIIWTFNSGTNASYTINRFNFMIGAYYPTLSTDIYITNIKMEEGTVATAFILNPNDEFYTESNHGLNETFNGYLTSFGRDYLECTEFYEI